MPLAVLIGFDGNCFLDGEKRPPRLAGALKQREELLPQARWLDPGVAFGTELGLLLNRAAAIRTVHTRDNYRIAGRCKIKNRVCGMKGLVDERVFAKTGKGYLRSEGVRTLQKMKANLRRKASLKGA